MQPFDKLWLLCAFLFSVYPLSTCCTPVISDALYWCLSSHPLTRDIPHAIAEQQGRLTPSSKSASDTQVSKLFFGFIRNIKGVLTLNSISSLSLEVVHLHTYNFHDPPCLLFFLWELHMIFCVSFCIHVLEDTVSLKDSNNLNRARMPILLPALFESGIKRLWFSRSQRERPALETRTK